jgi:predicted SnoaL-like aldol condensation-catalyzing enzyme
MTTHRLTTLAFTVLACGAVIAAQQTAPPETPVGNDYHIYYTEGNQVVQIAQRWSPDPAAAGAFYETFEWIQNAARVTSAPSRKVPAPGCTATPEQIAANKTAAAEFWRVGITPPERIALVDPGYTQHNPTFHRYALENKVTDYQTLTVMATRAGPQRAPQPITAGGRTLTPDMFDRVIAACDVVTQIHKFYVENPGGSGSVIERFTWDTFRVRNGKMLEHWDGTFLPTPAPPAAPAARGN